MATFDRWASAIDRTWEYRRFHAHHTEANSNYWAYWAVAHQGQRIARPVADSIETAALFRLQGDNARRAPRTVGEWLAAEKEAANWIRLSTAVSMASYLETYLRQVTTLALWSDPALTLGSTKLIDGVAVLKRRNSELDVSSSVDKMVKGLWSSRIDAYRRIFGVAPARLDTQAVELQALQTLRNRVSHEFGRDNSMSHLAAMAPLTSAVRLSEGRLMKWLGMVEEVAQAIDSHLLNSHIGAFECLLLLHRERERRRRALDVSTFRKLIAAAASGPIVNTEYCRMAMSFYRRA